VKRKRMDLNLWILLGLTVAAFGPAWLRGGTELSGQAAASGWRLFQGVWLELALGFLLAGAFDALVPQQTMVRWLGEEHGARGILIAWVVGLLIPGGPYVFFPVVASLFAKGVSAGALITLITAKTLISPVRMLTYEAPLVGWPLTLARLLPALFLPPLAGVIGAWLFQLLRSRP
jgi:uncharacterized membrane protein YraQ (UPF0718 family)